MRGASKSSLQPFVSLRNSGLVSAPPFSATSVERIGWWHIKKGSDGTIGTVSSTISKRTPRRERCGSVPHARRGVVLVRHVADVACGHGTMRSGSLDLTVDSEGKPLIECNDGMLVCLSKGDSTRVMMCRGPTIRSQAGFMGVTGH